MTRRERLERRAERRREWAEGRDRKSGDLLKRNERFHGDIAFNTQPGHIPERARAIARSDRAAEHYGMARHHEAKADGIERQLETAIFFDDDNAAEACEAKAAEIDAQAEIANAVNRVWRKHGGRTDRTAELLTELRALGCTEDEVRADSRTMVLCPYLKGPRFAGNLRANARRYRERAKEIRRRQAAQDEAQAAPGGVVIARHTETDYCSVRFAEKPERAILDALRAAGFRWGAGAWSGATSKLPAAVAELVGR